MKRYAVILAGTVLALAAAVDRGGRLHGGFGSQQSVAVVCARGQAAWARTRCSRPRKSLPQLRGVNFVSGCRFSHRNTDDPIVYPGQPGKSHDHTFLGNDTTNAFSTVETMLGQSTSCRRPGDTAGVLGADADRRERDAGRPATARPSTTAATRSPRSRRSRPGFKMIAGNSKATSAQGLKITSWNCGPAAGVRPQARSRRARTRR